MNRLNRKFLVILLIIGVGELSPYDVFAGKEHHNKYTSQSNKVKKRSQTHQNKHQAKQAKQQRKQYKDLPKGPFKVCPQFNLSKKGAVSLIGLIFLANCADICMAEKPGPHFSGSISTSSHGASYLNCASTNCKAREIQKAWDYLQSVPDEALSQMIPVVPAQSFNELYEAPVYIGRGYTSTVYKVRPTRLRQKAGLPSSEIAIRLSGCTDKQITQNGGSLDSHIIRYKTLKPLRKKRITPYIPEIFGVYYVSFDTSEAPTHNYTYNFEILPSCIRIVTEMEYVPFNLHIFEESDDILMRSIGKAFLPLSFNSEEAQKLAYLNKLERLTYYSTDVYDGPFFRNSIIQMKKNLDNETRFNEISLALYQGLDNFNRNVLKGTSRWLDKKVLIPDRALFENFFAHWATSSYMRFPLSDYKAEHQGLTVDTRHAAYHFSNDSIYLFPPGLSARRLDLDFINSNDTSDSILCGLSYIYQRHYQDLQDASYKFLSRLPCEGSRFYLRRRLQRLMENRRLNDRDLDEPLPTPTGLLQWLQNDYSAYRVTQDNPLPLKNVRHYFVPHLDEEDEKHSIAR